MATEQQSSTDPDRISGLSLDDLRAARRQAETEEQELSYVRRLLHGRIDIIRAELNRRSGEGEGLIDELPSILSDENPRSGGGSRFVSVEAPKAGTFAADAGLAISETTELNLATASDDQLTNAIESLISHERSVSSARNDVHRQIDAYSSELTRRYRDGSASVDDLLAGPAKD